MYTSGSTGEPKGVAQNHRNVLSKVMGWVNVVHISPGDRLSMLRAFHVSGSIRDLFGGLLCGAAVLPYDVKREGFSHLASWLVDENITLYNSVVTLFRSFGATLKGSEDFSTIRLIKLSGEPVYKRDVDIFKKYFADSCLLINMLAMAEAGSARVYFMGRETPIVESVVPIGYPLEDCEVLLIDADGKASGLNQVGEIAIRSRYLSPGYWRRTDLTEAAFLPDPQGGDSRIFRTGDLGSMLSDGCLVHRGRKDSHVKIRGYSVEVVEVQAALIELDGVQAAVVTTRENSHGEQILVAYVVPGGQAALDASFLRKSLAARLPGYMVPSVFVFLKSLPLAGPGKIDLRALPSVGRERPVVETPFALPRTPVEKYLTKVWAQLLDLDQVGIHDGFLELGGDSLLASRLICQVRDVLHVEVPIRSLFERPTVAEMAVEVERTLTEDYTPDEIDHILSEVEGLSSERSRSRTCSMPVIHSQGTNGITATGNATSAARNSSG
jgi:acyl-coenzyme A synthetase/AMP-(fatty) acid ligase